MRSRLTLAPVVALLLLVTGCATTVDGSGSPGSPGSTSRTASSSTLGAPVPSLASSTADPSVTSVPSAPSSAPAGTASSSPVAGLTCAPGAITAPGAPFCYPLPSGFTDYSTLTNYAQGWTYRTLISIGRHDLVEVLASPYTDTTSLSQTRLTAEFDRSGRLRVGEYDIVRAGSVTTARVAGGRAFVQTGVYRSGVRAENTTIFLGRTIASVQCQSQDKVAQVRAACAQVRATLQLVRL